jgi:hypothetical protein
MTECDHKNAIPMSPLCFKWTKDRGVVAIGYCEKCGKKGVYLDPEKIRTGAADRRFNTDNDPEGAIPADAFGRPYGGELPSPIVGK